MDWENGKKSFPKVKEKKIVCEKFLLIFKIDSVFMYLFIYYANIEGAYLLWCV